MDFIKDFLSEQGGSLISQLTSGAGFGQEQAERFVPAAIQGVLDVVKGGGLDLGSLLGGGDPSALVSAVDTQALAQKAGVDASQASEGLRNLAPSLLDGLKQKAGGAEGLLSMLGSDPAALLGKAGGDAGGLLGKVGSLLKR